MSDEPIDEERALDALEASTMSRHWTCECGRLHPPRVRACSACGQPRDGDLRYEPIPEGYAEPDFWMRCADGYARVCAALGVVHPDGTPGDVDAVLACIEVLQRRAARVHELEASIADAWDAGAEYTQREAATRGMSWPSYAHAANPYREKP